MGQKCIMLNYKRIWLICREINSTQNNTLVTSGKFVDFALYVQLDNLKDRQVVMSTWMCIGMFPIDNIGSKCEY